MVIKAISSFIKRIKVDNLPQEVREKYIRTLHYYNSVIVDIEEKAKVEGKVEGLIEGEQIGEQKAKREMALKMIRKGLDDESIIELSGLTQSELDDIKG